MSDCLLDDFKVKKVTSEVLPRRGRPRCLDMEAIRGLQRPTTGGHGCAHLTSKVEKQFILTMCIWPVGVKHAANVDTRRRSQKIEQWDIYMHRLSTPQSVRYNSGHLDFLFCHCLQRYVTVLLFWKPRWLQCIVFLLGIDELLIGEKKTTPRNPRHSRSWSSSPQMP